LFFARIFAHAPPAVHLVDVARKVDWVAPIGKFASRKMPDMLEQSVDLDWTIGSFAN
jgi:hypothetical protein